MACRCVGKLNKELKPKGCELDMRMGIDFSTRRMTNVGPLLGVRWIGEKPRGKSLPTIVCAYCPICGKKK